MLGTEVRLRRLLPPRHRLFAVPLDHALSMGPIEGLEASAPTARALVEGGAELLVVPPGAVRAVAPELARTTFLGVHLSASTSLGPDADRKVLTGTAADAVALGADLVSVQVNFGTPHEGEMLRDLGAMAAQCRSLGVPLLCMAYAKGPAGGTPSAVAHAARAAAELGADLVKTSYPGSVDALRSVVATTPVPVLLGGGARLERDGSALDLVRAAVESGAAGICIGRNLFQRPPLAEFAREVAATLNAPRP